MMLLALSPTPTSSASFLLTHYNSSGFDFTSHSNAMTEAILLAAILTPGECLSTKIISFYFTLVFIFRSMLSGIRNKHSYWSSEASDFRELANIQYAASFIIFSLPPKEVFYMFGITVVIFYSKDILSLLFITFNWLWQSLGCFPSIFQRAFLYYCK